MLQNERHEKIVQWLKTNKTIRIGDISKKLNVTRETARKDLYILEKQGLVKKVHGGAVLNKTSHEPPHAHRKVSNVKEKESIVRCAIEFVEDGDALYIDQGTTMKIFAENIKEKQDIIVVTNSLLVAQELSMGANIKVILSGGELRPGDLSLSGPVAVKSLEDFYIDKVFLGVGGLSIDHGITDYHVGESEIRRIMLQKAKKTFALADYSKFNVTAFTKVCDMSAIDYIITDSKAPSDQVKTIQELGVQVIVAEDTK